MNRNTGDVGVSEYVDSSETTMSDPMIEAIASGSVETIKRIVTDEINDSLKNKYLHTAIKKSTCEIVEIFLKAGFDVNGCNAPTFSTPLHVAALLGNREKVNLLKKYNAKLDSLDSMECLPLHHAALLGHKDIIESLIAQNAHKKNKHGKSPIYLAIDINRDDCVDILLKETDMHELLTEAIQDNNITAVKYLTQKKSVNPSIVLDGSIGSAIHEAVQANATACLIELVQGTVDLDVKDHYGFTPLYLAVQKQHVEVIDILLKNGCDVNAVNDLKEETTALHCAASNNADEVVRLLVAHGARADRPDANGCLPLHNAVETRSHDVIKYVMIKDWNDRKNINNKRKSPFYIAVEKNDKTMISVLLQDINPNKVFLEAIEHDETAVVDYFLNRSRDKNPTPGPSGWYPLHYAAAYGRLNMIEKILKYHWNKNVTTDEKDTALHLAAKGGYHNCISHLSHLDFTRRNASGQNALHCAAASGQVEAVKAVLKAGKNIDTNTEDSYGNTLVHFAAMSGSCEIIDYLESIVKPLNLNLKSKLGFSPLYLAAERGHLEMVIKLLKLGCNIEEINGENNLTAFDIATREKHFEIAKLVKITTIPISSTRDVTYKDNVVEEWTIVRCDTNETYTENENSLIIDDDDLNKTDDYKMMNTYRDDEINRTSMNDLEMRETFSSEQYDFMENVRDYNELLISLVLEGDTNKIVILLEKELATPSELGPDGWNAIHHAANCGNDQILAKLLEYTQYNDSVKTREGDTAAHLAVYERRYNVILNLKNDFNTKNNRGLTPLHCAVIDGDCEMTRVILMEADYGSSIKTNDGYNVFHLAAIRGHQQMIQVLFKCGVDFNDRSIHGYLPLYLAAEQGHLEIVQTLIRAGCDVNAVNGEDRWTALHVAAREGHELVASALMESEADPGAKDVNGDRALHVAVRSRHPSVIQLFTKDVELNAKNYAEETALYLAVDTGDENCVKAVLATGRCKVGVVCGELRSPALHLAVVRKAHALVELLLRAKADAAQGNAQGHNALHLAAIIGSATLIKTITRYDHSWSKTCNDGYTPLCYAVAKQQPDLIKECLLNGCNPNQTITLDKKTTLLHHLVESNNTEMLEFALKKGADPLKYYVHDLSSFHEAVKKNMKTIVDIFLQCEINLDHKSKDGCTLLYYAAVNNNEYICEQLLSKGCKKNFKNGENGSTAFHVAANNGHVGLVKIFIRYKMNSNVMDNCGMCPIHLAASAGHKNIVKLLINDQNLKSGSGENALDYATLHNHFHIVDMLNKIGAETISRKLHAAVGDGEADNVKRLLTKVTSQEQDDCGLCPLHIAVIAGNTDIVQIFIDANMDLNIKCKHNKTPLYYAISNDKSWVASKLLENGCDVNLRLGEDHSTTLHYVVENGLFDFAKKLLEYKADPRIKNRNGLTSIDLAKMYKANGFLKLFDAWNSRSNDRDDFIKNNDRETSQDSNTFALHEAVRNGSVEDVKRLLVTTTSEQHDADGLCPLHIAASTGNVDILQVFIDKNMNLDVKCNNNKTPLYYAISNDHSWMTNKLLENGCDVNLRLGDDDSTMLHYVVKNDLFDFAKQLLEHKGDPQLPNKNNSTPFSIAKKRNMTKFVKEFEKKRDFKNQTYGMGNASGSSRQDNIDSQYDIIKSKEMGPVLIFNFETFKNETLKPRRDNQNDAEALKLTWKSFGFNPLVFDDFSTDRLLKTIKRHADRFKPDIQSSFGIVILSYSEENGLIHTNDGVMKIDEIEEILKHNSLTNKPKFLIVQACRGTTKRRETNTTVRPKTEHVLIFNSTVENDQISENESGSPFVKNLCEILSTRGDNEDMCVVFRSVIDEFSNRLDYEMSQLPEIASTFDKKFILKKCC